MKPILFNTEMVRAILEGRKTVTRRVVKPQYDKDMDGNLHWFSAVEGRNHFVWEDNPNIKTLIHMPYYIGDILYVRETWCQYGKLDDNDRLIDGTEKYYYRADGENPTPFNDFLVQHPGWDEHRENPVWHPSIHMPKEAARLFLRVTDVRVERLQDINGIHAKAEGCEGYVHINPLYGCPETVHNFKALWDTTIKPAELHLYGWEANPWVWVIEFERCEKPKEDEA